MADELLMNGKKVVFCDDDQEILGLLVEIGQVLGLDAYGFTEPKELIRNLERIKPDVIVSDIEMPGFNGFQLIELLKEENVGIPFIFLTGYASVENYRRGFIDGQFEFLTKPIDFNTLEDTIRKALAFGGANHPTGRLVELLERSLRPVATARQAI